MEIIYLEYRIVYTPNFIKKVFSTSEEREKYIINNRIAITSSFMYRTDYFIDSQETLINVINTFL